ncbi:hypothetical protein [Rhodococcoides corynebacterioides]|uniref:hypothetical protein n=1 Tax=Rhodococcoides corynebacterioides TaxID=53972 RepID=UPI0008330BBF|nr:hypothetical protein [Rhodococcus corynebacterioides]
MTNNFHNSPNYGTINIHQTTVGYVVPQRSWARRHPILALILGFFALGFIVEYWWLALLGAAVWLGVRSYRKREAGRELARQEQMRLIASAHAQNQAFLQGNHFGTHGHFPVDGRYIHPPQG